MKQAKIPRKILTKICTIEGTSRVKTLKLITVIVILLQKVFQPILLLAWLSMWCKINANYRLILVPCLASSVRLRIAYKVPAVAKLSSSSPTKVCRVIVYKSHGEQCLLVQCKTCTFVLAQSSSFKKLKVYETKQYVYNDIFAYFINKNVMLLLEKLKEIHEL